MYLFYFISLFSLFFKCTALPTIHGRYTRDITNYHLVIPHKLDHEGHFLTYELPHFYEHRPRKTRQKRERPRTESLNYGMALGDRKLHLRLWPNHDFISPSLVVESNTGGKIKNRKLRKLEKNQCHYTGYVDGQPNSRVAISGCDGLAGYIIMGDKPHYIEPLDGHEPNEDGQHLHVVYLRDVPDRHRRCGTSEDWEKAWENRFRRKFENGLDVNVPKRGLESVHRYLEVLVVADKKFLQYHKDKDYQTYLLTVMNMVSNYYHDSTVGNQLDVVIVRMMYLDKEEEQIDLEINQDADKSLDSFCKWQQKINPQDPSNPNHHDIAVLITRYDICTDEMKSCSLLGLAYLATACTKDQPCAINEDSGLVLGVVVAHEIGHVMGCTHDNGEGKACKAKAPDNSYHVMSPYVHMNTLRWSPCSRRFITTFLENEFGDCLNDEPEETIYKTQDMLPGVMYDGEYQCKESYPNSTVCPVNKETFCERLYCRITLTECASMGEPAADGTKCGENKWCYNKECVEIGERPEAVNGGWSEWSEWTSCTRSCGGGVSYSERECNNPVPQHKGRYCLGERKKVQICNTDPCPEDAKSFREVQCEEFDSEPFNGKLYHWSQHIVLDDPCTLYCINDQNVYSRLGPRAKDGTPCKAGTNYMCIAGSCKKVGCDWKIDSDLVFDVCGVCGGDGTDCKVIDEVYRDFKGSGYQKVATLPSGSRNIHIEELAPSDNTLAISNKDESTYYLNGNYTEEESGMYKIGRSEGFYDHPEPNRETLTVVGPIKEPLVFSVVFYENENVGYHYKYSIATSKQTYTPHYHWEFIQWGDCSTRCGGGTEIAEPSCVEEKAGRVTDNFCNIAEKPQPTSRLCNQQACKTMWRTGKWGQCSACLYRSGFRVRQVTCVQENPIPGEDDIIVEDWRCEGPKPGNHRLCYSNRRCERYGRYSNSFLPDEMLSELWGQMNHQRANGEHFYKKHRHASNNTCYPDATESTETVSFNIGAEIKDTLAPEELVVHRVPIKPDDKKTKLSDTEYEKFGDQIGKNVLDMSQEKNLTGQEAAEFLKQMASNTSNCNIYTTERVHSGCNSMGRNESEEYVL